MTQFDDLNEDCLIALLDLLSTKELLKMVQLNRRLNRLANDKLQAGSFKFKVVAFNDSNNIYSKCAHLGPTDWSQVLVLKTMFSLVDDAPRRASLLSLLAKCTGVKCFDFGKYEMPGDLLLEVFRCCPELECVKFVKADEWSRVLSRIGHKIIHVVKEWDEDYDEDGYHFMSNQPRRSIPKEDARLLMAVAKNCRNIRHVEWNIGWPVRRDLAEAFKMLPRNSTKKLSMELMHYGYRENVWNLIKKFKLEEYGVEATYSY